MVFREDGNNDAICRDPCPHCGAAVRYNERYDGYFHDCVCRQYENQCFRCSGTTLRHYCECHFGERHGPIQEVGHFQIKSPLESGAERWFKIVDVWSEQQAGELRFRFRHEQWLRSPSAGRETAIKLAKHETDWRLGFLLLESQRTPVARKKQTKTKPKPPKGRFEILRRDNFTCVYCGQGPGEGVQIQVDHVVPLSRGGTDDPRNLRAACRPCNISKGAKVLPDVIDRFTHGHAEQGGNNG